jgi:membrane protein implicated in regulation of membrane protease activity
MQIYAYWFMLAFVFIAVEIFTGTFYFLMLAIAAMLGGVAAVAGLDVALQYAIVAAAAVAGTLLLRHIKKSQRAVPDIGPDVGQTVKVLAWHPDGTARVYYRGAEWDAEPESADTPREATFYIKAMQGSRIILTALKPE